MKNFSKLAFAFSTLLASSLWGWDDSPLCFKQMETNFFVESYVSEAMSFDRTIPQSNWSAIHRGLKERSVNVPRLLQKEAALQTNNPLEHPFQAKPAFDLLMKILYTQFREVMINNLITNESEIQEMFRYVQNKQKKLIASCLGEKIYEADK